MKTMTIDFSWIEKLTMDDLEIVAPSKKTSPYLGVRLKRDEGVVADTYSENVLPLRDLKRRIYSHLLFNFM